MSADRVKSLEADKSALSTNLLLSKSRITDLESRLSSTEMDLSDDDTNEEEETMLSDDDTNEEGETLLGAFEDEDMVFQSSKRKRSSEIDNQMNQEDKSRYMREGEREAKEDRLSKIVSMARQLVLSVGSGDGSQQAAIALAGHENLITTFYDTEEQVDFKEKLKVFLFT